MISSRLVLLGLLLGAAPVGALPLPAGGDLGIASTLRPADAQVAKVAYRLALRGAPLCGQAYPLTGLLFHHLAEYRPTDRSGLIARYGLDRGPGVLTVLGDSPAAKAGLIAGDVLLSVNGRAFESGAAIAADPVRKRWRARTEAAEAQLESELREGPARLIVLRDEQEVAMTLGSVAGCPGRVRLAQAKEVNAFATGAQVIMTTGMLEFLRNEDELAVVLGHEMSHNILRHPAILDEKGVPKKGILRSIGKNASRVWKTEEEADRLGVRLVWQSGYDVNAAIPFWRRFLGRYDWFPQIFRTHPSLPVRERITREEIATLPAERPPAP